MYWIVLFCVIPVSDQRCFSSSLFSFDQCASPLKRVSPDLRPCFGGMDLLDSCVFVWTPPRRAADEGFIRHSYWITFHCLQSQQSAGFSLHDASCTYTDASSTISISIWVPLRLNSPPKYAIGTGSQRRPVRGAVEEDCGREGSRPQRMLHTSKFTQVRGDHIKGCNHLQLDLGLIATVFYLRKDLTAICCYLDVLWYSLT